MGNAHTLPFRPAAEGMHATPQRKYIIVSDWGGTISLGVGRLNEPLLKFLSLAQGAGHTVIIGTKKTEFSVGDNALYGIRDMLDMHDDPLPEFPVMYKQDIKGYLHEMHAKGEIDHEEALVVFDDDDAEVAPPHGYVKAVFLEHVEAGRLSGQMGGYAKMLGFGQEYFEFLASYRPKGYEFGKT